MKNFTVIVLALLFCGSLLAVQDEVLTEVEHMLGKEQYSEVLSLLSKSIRKHAADPVRQALYVKALGDFYKDICGNVKKAAVNYRKVINFAVPGDHPVKSAAMESLTGINELETKYREKNAKLKALMSRANRKREPAAVKKDIAQLKAFIKSNPGYYLLHEAYYALGLNYEVLGESGDVYRSLEKAMEIKPGIVFYLAVKWKAAKAYGAYKRSVINNVMRWLFWLLLIITMIVFYVSKPWKWLGFRHLILFIVLIFSWWIVFNLSFFIVGTVFENSETARVVKPEDLGKDIEYLHAVPGSPGSEVVKPLFWYGIIGVTAIFIFSLGVGRIRLKKYAVIMGCVYGFLVFLLFSVLFYMTYCDGRSIFKSEDRGVFHYPGGRIHFAPVDPEPYVLTHPLDYPGLDVENITDPYLRKWVEKYAK